jgi:phosphate transport system permease protein
VSALSTPAGVARGVALDLSAPRARLRRERAFQGVLMTATLVALLVMVTLLFDVLSDGAARLNQDFFTSYTSRRAADTGIRTGLTGSLSLMVLVAGMSFPIGVGAGIYLEIFAPDNRFTRFMQVNIANLAGVPSVVYGLLAAAMFVYIMGLGRTLISGALALTLLILPVIIVASREAIRAVPPSIFNGALALGATPWQATRKQVLPVAMPGILTGTILALSRAVGETAPILVAGAVFSRRADNEPWNILEAFGALPVQVYDFIKRPQAEFQTEVAAAGIIVMLTVLLTMNSGAIILRNRYARRR